VVTFVELAPDGGGSDDEQLRGRRIRTPAWVTRACYLALVAVMVGAVLAGDGTSLVRSAVTPIVAAPAGPPTGGYIYADRGHCPITIDCRILGQARIDLWASYNHLFPDTQAITSSVWYEPGTGLVYFQELDAIGASAETITLTQERISGPQVPFGPTIDRSPKPPRRVLVMARRGPWLVSAALYSPRGGQLPVMAAMRWVATSPLPG
jgi:hypothetical protein